MRGGDCDHSGTGPLIDTWTSRATAIQTGPSAYRKAADRASVARKPWESLTTAVTPIEHTPWTTRAVEKIRAGAVIAGGGSSARGIVTRALVSFVNHARPF